MYTLVAKLMDISSFFVPRGGGMGKGETEDTYVSEVKRVVLFWYSFLVNVIFSCMYMQIA